MPSKGAKKPAVRLLRERRGWSREDLASRAKVSFPTLVRVELGGTPSVRSLLGLADALGVTLDELVGRSRPAPRDKRGASPK